MNQPCAGFEELLSPYYDGESVGEERDAVEAHLAGCAGCREAVEAYREIDAPIRTLAGAEAETGAPVVEEIEWRKCWATIAAAIAVVEHVAAGPAEAARKVAAFVYRLIPLAAAAVLVLVAYAYSISVRERAEQEAARRGAHDPGAPQQAELLGAAPFRITALSPIEGALFLD